jgi:hypothetical protein
MVGSWRRAALDASHSFVIDRFLVAPATTQPVRNACLTPKILRVSHQDPDRERNPKQEAERAYEPVKARKVNESSWPLAAIHRRQLTLVPIRDSRGHTAADNKGRYDDDGRHRDNGETACILTISQLSLLTLSCRMAKA